ncbi:helix-turn-helix transcriptional regulator [Abiotrophia defectiva]|uniref:helix-turn-helix transcriptional regulator n=1 Tax=Abiotrophia defectiva TaxID=46125 RepID=UPI0028D22868|nr:helix-turn-helix transcriptional regulator [Abiotrophia defectiva]
MKFKCNMKKRRQELKITQEELAEISGVSRATISLMENGLVVNSKIETISKLAKALDSKIEDIFLVV